METIVNVWKLFKINNKNKRAMLLTPCMVNLGSISINFEQI